MVHYSKRIASIDNFQKNCQVTFSKGLINISVILKETLNTHTNLKNFVRSLKECTLRSTEEFKKIIGKNIGNGQFGRVYLINPEKPNMSAS